MIFSKKHKFLFLKGRKVAGTSFEVALSKICGAEDIITPITPIDERHRIDLGCRHAQNFGADPEKLKAYIDAVKTASPDQIFRLKKPKGSFENHCTFDQAWDLIGEALNGHRVIAIARNPYQKILSALNHLAVFNDYKKSGQSMHASRHQLQEKLALFLVKLIKKSYSKNISLYSLSRHVNIPLKVEYLKFEDLQAELNRFLVSLKIEEVVTLPHLKKGLNLPPEAILEIADSEQLAIINDYFDDEFTAFGYQKLEH